MKFIAEIERRNVHRAAVFYAGAAWLLVQIATQVFPVFNLPAWTMRLIVVAVVVGFPFAMLFSWFYEWTPQGIRRENEVERDAADVRQAGKKMDRWIIAVLGLAVVLLLTDRFVLHADVAADRAASIAVLPLSNESGNPDEQYFSDGLSEDLITALSQFGGLKVISRNSSFQFRDSHEGARAIGVKLGVVHLLEGSVRRAGDVVRVRTELVSAEDGSTLWSQKFDRPYKDLFALQDDITHAVAAALKTRLTTEAPAPSQSDHPPGGSLDAYNAYLQARFRTSSGAVADYRKGIESYEEAVRLDPAYARAYALMSLTWTGLARSALGGSEKLQAYARAEEAAKTALRIDPNLGAAYLARGAFLESSRQDWDGANADYQHALALDPDYTYAKFQYGMLLAARGDLAQAIEVTQQLLVKDPRNSGGYNFLGKYLISLGRLDEAEQAIRKAVELRPANPTPYVWLANLSILRNDAAGALRWAEQTPEGNWRAIGLALALQIGDDRAAADAALETLIAQQADDSAMQIAEIYALRKDPNKMFEWLDHAWATHDSGIGLLLYDPFLQRYKDDPRFAAFRSKVGLMPSVPAIPAATRVNPTAAP